MFRFLSVTGAPLVFPCCAVSTTIASSWEVLIQHRVYSNPELRGRRRHKKAVYLSALQTLFLFIRKLKVLKVVCKKNWVGVFKLHLMIIE